MQGVYRTTWQGIIGSEQVLQDLPVFVTAVAEQGDDAGHELVKLSGGVEESLGNMADSVDLNGQDSLAAQHVHDLGDDHIHAFRRIRDSSHGLAGGNSIGFFFKRCTHGR